MSRVAKIPVTIPAGVDVVINDDLLTVKGPKGKLSQRMNRLVKISKEKDEAASADILTFIPKDGSREAGAQSGTARSLANNMVQGVNQPFERVLELVGVGYRAQVQGKKVNLVLGFSHPVVYDLPDNLTAESVSQTQLKLTSPDKQLLGQVAAEIRAYRPPEPYKGKGIRYAGEVIVRKETKKK